jgi:hypothetical protein
MTIPDFLSPCRYKEDVTVSVAGRDVKFEARHEEPLADGGTQLTTLTRTIELPFDITLRSVTLKPVDGAEGLILCIQKPTF